MENPIKMNDLGGFPTIFGNIQICLTENQPKTTASNGEIFCRWRSRKFRNDLFTYIWGDDMMRLTLSSNKHDQDISQSAPPQNNYYVIYKYKG